jgi:hypothetical protein
MAGDSATRCCGVVLACIRLQQLLSHQHNALHVLFTEDLLCDLAAGAVKWSQLLKMFAAW